MLALSRCYVNLRVLQDHIGTTSFYFPGVGHIQSIPDVGSIRITAMRQRPLARKPTD
jgi:hypothetical protein